MLFELDGDETLGNGAATIEAAPAAADRQPASKAVTVVPAPVQVSAADIEKGIQWPEPLEEAFWERPPRSNSVSLGAHMTYELLLTAHKSSVLRTNRHL